VPDRVGSSRERISTRAKDGCRRHLQIASEGVHGAEELLQFASIIAVDRRGFDTVKINYVIVKARDKGKNQGAVWNGKPYDNDSECYTI